MEHIVFDRPREKLQAKGVGHLTLVELLQIIIGSGNAKASGARLAKRVERVLEEGDSSVNTLQNIQGIGLAKACQIAAAIELGLRLNSEVVPNPAAQATQLGAQASQLPMHNSKNALHVYAYDGAQRELTRSQYIPTSREQTIRQITQGALLAQARCIKIVVINNNLTIESQILIMLRQLRSSLSLLDIKLSDVEVAHRERVKKWKI